MTDVKKRVIRLLVIKGPNARDQTALCAIHSFLVEVQSKKRILATYMRRMRSNNVGIRVAGSSSRPQLTLSTSQPPPVAVTSWKN